MSKSTPIWWNVWPWDLLIFIAEHKRIGNSNRLNLNGRSDEEGTKGILGINDLLPADGPCNIITSITLGCNVRTLHHVPLVMCGGSRDLSTITGQPTFSISLYGGKPAIFNEFKNSIEKWIASSAVSVESIEVYVTV